MEKIVNPLTGRKIKINGKIYKELVKKSVLTQNRIIKSQQGGNPMLMSLPPLTDLVIPGGLTIASYLSNKYLKKQTGGGNNINIIDNNILQVWLKSNHKTELQPSTLIPAGVLLAVYNQSIDQPINNKNTTHKQISELVNHEDLHKFMKYKRITKLDQHTELPFAIIMGPSIFTQYVQTL